MTPITDTHPTLLRILRGIDEAQPVGTHRQKMWERCWSEHETAPYFDGDVVRFHGQLYKAPGAELVMFRTLRSTVARKWLTDQRVVHEFGCGAGDNLVALRNEFGIEGVGYDWAESAVKRCSSEGIKAHVFDMVQPTGVSFGGALLTVHALEQLGSRWQEFLSYVMRARPTVCVHIEPIVELYDKEKLLDYLAISYHKKRGYLEGFYTRLRRMDADNEIELLDVQPAGFGNLFHCAYSVIVWRPS